MKHLLLILSCIAFWACNPKDKQKENSTENQKKEINDTTLQIKKDSSLSHILLFKYFPKEIKSFKTVGYPDKNDNPTGLPTGETASPYTYPKFISFAKHLYEKGEKSIAIEILDYKIETTAINDFKKMMAMDSAYENSSEINIVYSLSIPNTTTSYKVYINERKCEMHIVLCDRFVININILGVANGAELLKKVATVIQLQQLKEDYCNKH